MAHPFSAEGKSLALHTDLYQLTMAYGYWKEGIHDRAAVFHLTFRQQPFGGAYAVVAGLESVIESIEAFQFTQDDGEYLRSLGFEESFVSYLSSLRLQVSLDAMPEGTIAFPHEPLLRVEGPLLQCQLLETLLLNLVNFQTLIATKGARVALAARGDEVIEFGMRRAQGVDGALSATRSTYVGGCHSTSNTLAGKLYGIPVRGTMAHSWVMAFDSEEEAFAAYARQMPDNCVLLVDTYESCRGVKRAIEVARRTGVRLRGVRLDSGDLLQLSLEARALLDREGFHDTAIVASNNLDEWEIERLKNSGSPISIWGVGTHMVTGYGQPALGGVYKLGAIQEGEGWSHRMKRSDEGRKSTEPGILGVQRFFDEGGRALRDLICTADLPNLLVPIFRQGERVYSLPTLQSVRQKTLEGIGTLPGDLLRFEEPGSYPVDVDPELVAQKRKIAQRMRDE